jgi:NH3-dependent NAD+ synthetase
MKYEDLIAAFSKEKIDKVKRMIQMSEFKRNTPPIIK